MVSFRKCALALLLSVAAGSSALAQFDKAAQWIPDDANMLILINADRLMGSEMAKQEDWASSKAFERGNSVLPPGVGTAFFASQFDFQVMEPIWTVGVFRGIDSRARLSAVAQRMSVEMDELMDRPVAPLTGDMFAVSIDPETIGVFAPSDRQGLAKWLKQGFDDRVTVTPYLSQAIEFADKNADVIIAFDMANAISAAGARSRLLRIEGVKPSDIDTLATAASKLQGFTLGITIRDKSYGALKIDFEQGTKGLDRINKRLLLGILGENGVMVDDAEDWTVSTEGSSVTFGGWMSVTGLRKVNLLVNQPIRNQFAGAPTPGQSQEVDMAKNTAEFLDAIELYLRELDQFAAEHRSSSAKAYARWFDKYANKIDSMSIRGVDTEVVDFAASMAREFRNVSMVLTKTDGAIQSRTVAEREYGSYYYYGDYYGHRSRNYASGQLVKAQESASATNAAKTIMQELRNKFGDLRRSMTTKYNL
jgi:hypothetical protein